MAVHGKDGRGFRQRQRAGKKPMGTSGADPAGKAIGNFMHPNRWWPDWIRKRKAGRRMQGGKAS